jgi:predicted lipoprotein with Yx(FWY)xxD motif
MDRRSNPTGLVLLAVTGVLAVAACGSNGSTAAKASSSGATTTTASAPPAVTVAANPTLGSILVDPQGMTVYRNDTEVGGVIKCTGTCATAWPPLVASGTPVATPSLGHTLGVITRPDGTMQVTEDNWPLYHFAADKVPGDTKGNGIGGIWHVVNAGATTSTTAPAAATATTSSGGYGY